MHLCLAMECIASSLQFLQHCLSVFQSISFNLIWSPPRPAAVIRPLHLISPPQGGVRHFDIFFAYVFWGW